MTSILVLGSGQDAGIPHTGCHCKICSKARVHHEFRRLGSSVAVLDSEAGYCYLVDASPDLKTQLDMVHGHAGQPHGDRRTAVTGILLTHAHFGHASGLWQFGKESMNAKALPVYCTPAMAEFLESDHPLRLLVEEKNIDVREIEKGRELRLGNFTCTPIEVPHRNEIADTVGFIIVSKKRVVYIPDIDHWTEETIKVVRESDVAIIDGTFFSKDEIARFHEVKHPPINETVELIGTPRGKVYFTHINHTNPINENGKEREFVEGKGFGICNDGMVLEI